MEMKARIIHVDEFQESESIKIVAYIPDLEMTDSELAGKIVELMSEFFENFKDEKATHIFFDVKRIEEP